MEAKLIKFPKGLLRELKAQAAELGVNSSELVRRAVAEVLVARKLRERERCQERKS